MSFLNLEFQTLIMFGGVALCYLIACLVLPWVPYVRNVLGIFHTVTTRWMFPGLTIGTVFALTTFVSVGLCAFLALVEFEDIRVYVFIPITLFIFGLGGVFSINMMPEVIIINARKSGVMPSFGDDKNMDSPMSLIGMRGLLEPTYKRAPIKKYLLTGDDETLLPKLRPFVPFGWI